jgi:hypothetical protein
LVAVSVSDKKVQCVAVPLSSSGAPAAEFVFSHHSCVCGFPFCEGWWDVPVRTEIFFPLRAMKAAATVVDGVARVSVTQYFEMVTDAALPELWQTRYEIPFDEQGAITEFRASYGDRVIEGVVKSDEEAQKDFDDALDEGKPAVLGSQPSSGVFKLEFGNVPLEELVIVEFVYVTPVQARDKDTFRFIIPSTLAPEMNPSGASPETLEYDDGALILSVKAFSSAGTITVSSPTHSSIMNVTDLMDRGKQVDMVDKELDRRDIVILLETTPVQDVQTTVYRELYEDGTTAMMLSILPDVSSYNVERPSIEFIFLVDRSGSMSGDKIRQTATALEVVVNKLPAGSYFNFVSFGTTYQYLFGAESMPVDDFRDQGIIFANTLSANFGGTNIFDPIWDILQSSPTPGFDRALFVLTDGEVENTEAVIELISNRRGPTKCYSLGIGDADRELVNGIARAGGGIAEFVDNDELETITEVAENQVAVATEANFLSNFSVEWGSSTKGVQSPYRLDTVFSSRRTLLYYLTVDPTPEFVEITALVGGREPFSLLIQSASFVSSSTLVENQRIVGPMGAREAIRDLEEERSKFHSGEGVVDDTAVKDEIIRLGVKFQITSSETSFIAIDNQDWTSRNAPGTGTEGEDSGPSAIPGGGGGSFGICFSGQNIVHTSNRGSIRMKDVAIGDMVHVGDTKFSRVYSFGHRSTDTVSEYLQIHAEDLGQPLEISADHMLFVDSLGVVPASMVKVGDKLMLGASDASVAKVTRIATMKVNGAYAPFTETGTIVVSEVMASSYVSLQKGESNAFEIAGVKVVSMHWLAHAFQAPHRVVCSWSTSFCDEETYTEEGISTWVYGPFLLSKWLLDQHSAIMIVLSVPVVVTGVLFHVIEELFMMNGPLVLCALLGLFLVVGDRKKKAA